MTTDGLGTTRPEGLGDNESLDFQEADDLTTPETPEVETPTTQEPEKIVLELDPDNIAGSFESFASTNPQASNVISSLMGNRAKLRYQPEIDRLNAQLEEQRLLVAQTQINAMSDEEVQQKLASDPTFRQQYDSVQNAGPALQQRQQQLGIAQTINNTLLSAMENGLPESKATEILENVRAGKFNTDEQGNNLGVDGSLDLFRNHVMAELRTSVSGVAPNPAGDDSSNAGPSQPPIDTATPDISPTSAASTPSKRTMQEINSMTSEQLLEAFPGDEDLENAIRNGEIEGVSDETRQAYNIA